MLKFIRKICSTTMTLFSCNTLRCVSIGNQECKIRTETININSNEPSVYFYNILIKDVAAAAIILMIHMLNYAFLLLLKTWISRYLISCQELMKQDKYLRMRLVRVNVD